MPTQYSQICKFASTCSFSIYLCYYKGYSRVFKSEFMSFVNINKNHLYNTSDCTVFVSTHNQVTAYNYLTSKKMCVTIQCYITLQRSNQLNSYLLIIFTIYIHQTLLCLTEPQNWNMKYPCIPYRQTNNRARVFCRYMYILWLATASLGRMVTSIQLAPTSRFLIPIRILAGQIDFASNM